MIACKECKKLAEANADLTTIVESLHDEISLKDNVLIAIKEFVDNNKYKTELDVDDVFAKLNKIMDKYDF